MGVLSRRHAAAVTGVSMVVASLIPRALVIASLVLLGGAWPVAAEPQCLPGGPVDLTYARNYLFVATYLGKRDTGPETSPDEDFAVERVFAGEDRPITTTRTIAVVPGQTTTQRGISCARLGRLAVGHRYLMSLGTLQELTSMYSVAWELGRHGTITLVRQYHSGRVDPRLAVPTTLAEAVALMMPRSDLPPTDAVAGQGDFEPAGPALTLTALVGAVGAATVLRRRTQASRMRR